MRKLIRLALVGAVLIAAPALHAQAPAAPAPVPTAMPNNIPYGNTITADRGAELARAVMAEARKDGRDWKLAIAVVDPHGELVYFYKMDDTQYESISIATRKAVSAARLRRPTSVFFDQMQALSGAYVPTLGPEVVAIPGGYPLVENGKLIGAIGCSGAAGAQDNVACAAGAALVK